MRPARWLAAFIVSVAVLAGCAVAPVAPGHSASPGVGGTTVSLGTSSARLLAGQPMAPCLVMGEIPVKAEVPGLCGTLRVPEDRSNPGGRQIGLHVAVVPALAASPKPDPFFAIAGGPGDASTSFFAWLPGLYTGVHASRDIVLVDQRGTGASSALVMPPIPDTSAMSAAEADARRSGWATHGLAALDADPRAYTTSIAADDLDAVRAALGYDRINLYGASYGGTVAQYYLRLHPDHVRVAVLDGTTPLDVPVLELMAANSQHALDLLLTRCAHDVACHAAFPQLATEWSTLKAAFARGVTVTDPASGATAAVDLVSVGPSIHAALLTEAAAAQIPLAIHLASQGKWDQVSQLVPAPPSGGPTLLMKDEILCSEAWARFDALEVARTGAGSYFLPYALAWAREQASMCRALPGGVVPANDGAAVETTLPVLWLTGDGDPQDGPANLAAVPSQEPSSTIVVMPAQEHVVGHLGCGPAVIAAFVDAGTADGLDTTCVAQGAAPSPTFRLR